MYFGDHPRDTRGTKPKLILMRWPSSKANCQRERLAKQLNGQRSTRMNCVRRFQGPPIPNRLERLIPWHETHGASASHLSQEQLHLLILNGALERIEFFFFAARMLQGFAAETKVESLTKLFVQ